MTAQTRRRAAFTGAERLEAGDRIPPFALPDAHGAAVSPLDDFRAGRPLVLIFECKGTAPDFAAELSGLAAMLPDVSISESQRPAALAVTRRSQDENLALARQQGLSFPVLSDTKGQLYRACGLDAATVGRAAVTFVLDANLRLVALVDGGGASRGPAIAAALDQAAAEDHATAPLAGHPPVLVLPRTLSPEDCGDLIEHWHQPAPLWEAEGFQTRGFQQESGDFMVRNKDYGKVLQRVVRDAALQTYLDAKLNRRVIPEIHKAFSAKITRREEYRIAGYDAAEGGALGAHRDNPTKETRHRRFTVSVTLNAGDFEGGALRFGEYSREGYLVPTGTAIVWSCSLLHEVLPVTAGRRFILGTHLFGA